LGIDAYGGTVIDPTENVKALMEASIKSLTREAELSDLRTNESLQRLTDIIALRAEHAKETRTYDNDRWDKIRTIDMANAQATAKQILDAVNTYSAAQERIAQTLAKQVTDTAAAQEARNSAQYSDVTKRLQAVELSLSKGEGKQAVSDPQMDKLTLLVERLATNQTLGQGNQSGVDDSKKLVTWLLALALAAMTFYTFTQSRQQSPVYVSPPATTVTPPPVAR
jgi:hypothetical protein